MALRRTHLLMFLSAFLLFAFLLPLFRGAGGSPFGKASEAAADFAEKVPIRVLILPKFEVDGLSGDFPGEAQFYFEEYLTGAEEYRVPFATEDCRLYVKDGVALCLLGMGKLKAALNTTAVLSDDRFDFSDAYILSVGCGGSAAGTTVMGDVIVISAAADYDLGHHADARELTDPDAITWFHDGIYDETAAVRLNPQLVQRVWALVRDLPLETTERTRNYMRSGFDGAEWAVRDPIVQLGTSVTGDNYWKGQYDHENALAIVQTYGCPDPYAITEMEDVAVCEAVRLRGLLDRLIILRCSVDMDVFMGGTTPEILWGNDGEDNQLAEEDSLEAADIFATAMENSFRVGRTIIEAVLQGSF